MTTERDVWEIDTATAEANLRRLGEVSKDLSANMQVQKAAATEVAAANEKAGESGQKAGGFFKELGGIMEDKLTKSFFTANAAYDLLTKALRGGVDILKGSLTAALEAEEAQTRLAFALRGTAYNSEATRSAMTELAAALQDETGVADEVILGTEGMLASFGVLPSQVSAATQAILDYAAFTGKDATTATREFIGAMRGESDTLGKLKLDLDGATTEGERLKKEIDEISKHMGGAARVAMEGHNGQVRELTKNWGELQENIGKAMFKLSAMEGIKLGKFEVLMNPVRLLGSAMEGANELMKLFIDKPDKKKAEDELAAADAAGPRRLSLPEISLGTIESPAAKSRREAAERAHLASLRDDPSRLAEDAGAEADLAAAQRQEQQNERLLEAQTRFRDAWLDQEKEAADQELKIWDKLHDEEKKRDEQRAQEIKQHWESVTATIAGYAQQILSVQAGMLAEDLLANHKYDQEIQKATADRMKWDDASAALQEKLGQEQWARLDKTTKLQMIQNEADADQRDLQGELAAETDAANQKMLAGVFRKMAADAAVQALMETAHGLAALAGVYTAGLAPGHFAAAAAYAAVATAAGGVSLAIDSGRGKTGDERSRLEELNRRDERTARESANREKSTVAGPTITYNVFGIAGLTETEQMAELEKMQKRYTQLHTGSTVD